MLTLSRLAPEYSLNRVVAVKTEHVIDVRQQRASYILQIYLFNNAMQTLKEIGYISF